MFRLHCIVLYEGRHRQQTDTDLWPEYDLCDIEWPDTWHDVQIRREAQSAVYSYNRGDGICEDTSRYVELIIQGRVCLI